MARKHLKFEDYLHKKLQNRDFLIAYLNAALADEDNNVFLIALKNVLENRGQDLTVLERR